MRARQPFFVAWALALAVGAAAAAHAQTAATSATPRSTRPNLQITPRIAAPTTTTPRVAAPATTAPAGDPTGAQTTRPTAETPQTRTPGTSSSGVSIDIPVAAIGRAIFGPRTPSTTPSTQPPRTVNPQTTAPAGRTAQAPTLSATPRPTPRLLLRPPPKMTAVALTPRADRPRELIATTPQLPASPTPIIPAEPIAPPAPIVPIKPVPAPPATFAFPAIPAIPPHLVVPAAGAGGALMLCLLLGSFMRGRKPKHAGAAARITGHVVSDGRSGQSLSLKFKRR